MNSLVIGRLQTRFRADTPLPPARRAAWLGSLAEADDEALTAGLTGPDDWLLIRHLPLALRWHADAGEVEVRQLWCQALRDALLQAAARPDGDSVLRYSSRRAALADLLYRSALGERRRQWAWQQMGLIPRATLSPPDVLQRGLRLLQVQADLIWPVLHALIAGEAACASLTALLRGLPAPDWLALLRASPRSAGYVALLDATAGIAVGGSTTLAAADATLPAIDADVAPETSAAAGWQQLLVWVAGRPHFAAPHEAVLTLLAAALLWPAAGTPQTLLLARLQSVRRAVRARLPRAPRHAGKAAAAGDAAARVAAAPPPRDEGMPALPALPRAEVWLPTRWAGALFWLARLPASGLLAWQAAQDQVSLQGLLRALGEALAVPDDDPALRALCGGELPPDAATAAAREQAQAQVRDWADWLDASAPELPPPRLGHVCRRPGRLRFEAGWIELHLPLDGVDTGIRRLGLDLDPGWLPWLGCVLRIVYDE